jgi:serine/threonine protein kinase
VAGERYAPGALVAGKYRLESRLGEGGMGTVWLAHNVILGAPVALKLIHPGIQREDTVERLLVEARIQALLNHPNIVRVFDFGRTEFGDAFIIMEVLRGATLGDFIDERGRLRAVEAVQIILPIVAALCHAHDHGVVHRDLKPDNIFVVRDGCEVGPKLLDFGVAKVTHRDPAHRYCTPGGALLGSPAYMAPEQAWALDDVDHRADIWAICVVLYEAISGGPAFPGRGYTVLRKVVEEPLPALADRGAGEGSLSEVLARGLQKDRTRRFQSMRELGTALAQWLRDQGEDENHDLFGNRISCSWNVVVGGASAPARSIAGTGRLRVLPRAALAAATILFAAICMPSEAHVEAAAVSPSAAGPSFVAKPAPQSSVAIEGERAAEAPTFLTHGIASAEDSDERAREEPKRSFRRLSEAELGLKVPF